jgi:hypothetical protein
MSDLVLDFLIRAKQHTYAAQGDEASVSPLLAGSRQLEYREDPFFYRDIYFGVNFFVGQEMVYIEEQPYWSMSYAGGVSASMTQQEDVQKIYAFLRSALRRVSREWIFRGPDEFSDGTYRYENQQDGDFTIFHGAEIIRENDKIVYMLRYNGGVLS